MSSYRSFKSRLLSFKEHLYAALMVAPTLAVVLISAAYQLTAQNASYKLGMDLPLLLGVFSLLSLLASTVLAVVHERGFVSSLLALLFALTFLSELSFYLSGTTDLVSDNFFEMLMLIFSLPAWSYMSVSTCLGSVPAVPSLVITGLLVFFNVGATVWIVIRKRKGKARP